MSTAKLSSEEMTPASPVQVKPSRQSQGTPVLCAMLTVQESAKCPMLNTQLVISYTGNSGFCSDDCGGVSKVVNAEHTACGKLHR